MARRIKFDSDLRFAEFRANGKSNTRGLCVGVEVGATVGDACPIGASVIDVIDGAFDASVTTFGVSVEVSGSGDVVGTSR